MHENINCQGLCKILISSPFYKHKNSYPILKNMLFFNLYTFPYLYKEDPCHQNVIQNFNLFKRP